MMVFPAGIIHWFTSDREFIAKGVFPLRAIIIFLPIVGIQMLGGRFFQEDTLSDSCSVDIAGFFRNRWRLVVFTAC